MIVSTLMHLPGEDYDSGSVAMGERSPFSFLSCVRIWLPRRRVAGPSSLRLYGMCHAFPAVAYCRSVTKHAVPTPHFPSRRLRTSILVELTNFSCFSAAAFRNDLLLALQHVSHLFGVVCPRHVFCTCVLCELLPGLKASSHSTAFLSLGAMFGV